MHNECNTQVLRDQKDLTDKLKHVERFISQVLEYNNIHDLEVRVPDFQFQMNGFITTLDMLKSKIQSSIESDNYTSYEDLHVEANNLQIQFTSSHLFVEYSAYRMKRAVLDNDVLIIDESIEDTYQFKAKVYEKVQFLQLAITTASQESIDRLKKDYEKKLQLKTNDKLNDLEYQLAFQNQRVHYLSACLEKSTVIPDPPKSLLNSSESNQKEEAKVRSGPEEHKMSNREMSQFSVITNNNQIYEDYICSNFSFYKESSLKIDLATQSDLLEKISDCKRILPNVRSMRIENICDRNTSVCDLLQFCMPQQLDYLYLAQVLPFLPSPVFTQLHTMTTFRFFHNKIKLFSNGARSIVVALLLDNLIKSAR